MQHFVSNRRLRHYAGPAKEIHSVLELPTWHLQQVRLSSSIQADCLQSATPSRAAKESPEGFSNSQLVEKTSSLTLQGLRVSILTIVLAGVATLTAIDFHALSFDVNW